MARSVPARLARVFLQVAIAIAIAAGYYFMTTYLIGKMGPRGYLYALMAAAVAIALLREFWPDIRKSLRRAASAMRARRQARERAAAAPTRAAAPVPPPPGSAEEAVAEFRAVKARVDQGAMSAGDFQQFLGGFVFVDRERKFWTLQPDTGRWVYHRNGEWRPGEPLGKLSRIVRVGATTQPAAETRTQVSTSVEG